MSKKRVLRSIALGTIAAILMLACTACVVIEKDSPKTKDTSGTTTPSATQPSATQPATQPATTQPATTPATTTPATTTPTTQPATTTPAKSSLAAAYAAYEKVLRNNRGAILAYNWQTDKADNPINEPVALCDINNDGIPELFYVAADFEAGDNGDAYMATMHIYTYRGGNAVELPYKNYAAGTKDDGLSIENVAAGTKYVVYTSKKAGRFYISSSLGDEVFWYCINEYALDGNGNIRRVNLIKNTYDYAPPHSDVYTINGINVSETAGKQAFAAARENLKQVIIYSSNETSMSVWRKFSSGDELAMSYDNMMAYLKSKR